MTVWVKKADGIPSQYWGGGFVIDNIGYVVAGHVNGYSRKYNPVSDSWADIQTFPGGGLCCISNSGFSIGKKGYIGTGCTTQKKFWEYDSETNVWTQKADFGGTGRQLTVGFALDGDGYIGCGLARSGYRWYVAKDFWKYSVSSDHWSGPINAPESFATRCNPVRFVINDKAYIIGGNNGGNYSDVWEFDGSFSRLSDFPGGGVRGWMPGFAVGGKGYILTGGTGRDFWEYTPSTDSWEQLTDFPYYVTRGHAFGLQDKLYAGGGVGGAAEYGWYCYEPIIEKHFVGASALPIFAKMLL